MSKSAGAKITTFDELKLIAPALILNSAKHLYLPTGIQYFDSEPTTAAAAQTNAGGSTISQLTQSSVGSGSRRQQNNNVGRSQTTESSSSLGAYNLIVMNGLLMAATWSCCYICLVVTASKASYILVLVPRPLNSSSQHKQQQQHLSSSFLWNIFSEGAINHAHLHLSHTHSTSLWCAKLTCITIIVIIMHQRHQCAIKKAEASCNAQRSSTEHLDEDKPAHRLAWRARLKRTYSKVDQCVWVLLVCLSDAYVVQQVERSFLPLKLTLTDQAKEQQKKER